MIKKTFYNFKLRILFIISPILAVVCSRNTEIIYTRNVSKSSQQVLLVRSGDIQNPKSRLALGKTGPGPKAKARANKNWQTKKPTSSLSVNAFKPQQSCNFGRTHSHFHSKTGVKVKNNPFENNQNNHGYSTSLQENKGFENFRGGPNPYKFKYSYNVQEDTRESTIFTPRLLNHSFDGHAIKCFNITGNRNKQTLKAFENANRSSIESTGTQLTTGSYRYETPAFIYTQDGTDLIVVVNATNNHFITVINGTESQHMNIQLNYNVGLDTRPLLKLRLRGE